MDTFQRTTFTTDRTLEFFTKKELTMQIGHDPAVWPLALVKELIDNALDACEDAGRAPEILVGVEPDAVSVLDNGPGLPLRTLERSLDYMVRVSDKSYYVSPTRGQLGNALKCVWAAPFVADGSCGSVDVITGGVKHQIKVTLDRIAQSPNLERSASPDAIVKNGTLIRMHWPEVASYLDERETGDFYNGVVLTLTELLCRFLLFNPHLRLMVARAGGTVGGAATDPTWKKWRPSDPTSPHWYTPEQFCSLITAYLSHDRGSERRRSVRDLVAEFAGLKGSAAQKAVAAAAGLSGALLSDLISDGGIDPVAAEALLTAMQEAARPIKPAALGVIGKEHITRRLVEAHSVSPDSIRYAREVGEADGLPFVLEVAFGVCRDDDQYRDLIAGINWTPTLGWPFRNLYDLLTSARLDDTDPVVLVVHLACPRVGFHDRGKTSLNLPTGISSALQRRVEAVTSGWKDAKRRADRADRVRHRDLEALRKAIQPKTLDIKEAAYRVMAEAYQKASGNGQYPANARQIMYAARPLVLELTEGKCWKNSSYFTQTLLPDFVDDPMNARIAAGWDVVFDARGHLVEPHTARRTDLGTVAVRNYIADWTDSVSEDLEIELDHSCPTVGPANRYKFALFIEKEGFDALLARARIADRFDLAIMSTKGMSVTAARRLVESLSEQGVTILVLHDFDKSGLAILHTLRTDTRRYRFQHAPRVIDIGLRLAEAQEMQLASEPVTYDSDVNPKTRLRECGATEAECDFLVSGGTPKRWRGERIELNAMDSVQFVEFLERKLTEAGVNQKVVPDKEVLAAAWRRAWRRAMVQEAIDKATEEIGADEIPIPGDLAERVKEQLDGSSNAWDDVLWEIVREQRGD